MHRNGSECFVGLTRRQIEENKIKKKWEGKKKLCRLNTAWFSLSKQEMAYLPLQLLRIWWYVFD